MIKVNVQSWGRDIMWSITDWKEFRNSDLCETVDDRHNADDVIERLENMLNRIRHTGEVSESDFSWYISLL